MYLSAVAAPPVGLGRFGGFGAPSFNPALRRPVAVPVVLFPRSRVPKGFRGFGRLGDAASILANEQAYSTNPYLTSPAYLAAQAAALQGECANTPNSPACQVATLTGDVNTGYNPVADTQLNLQNWCEQNVFNANQFGTALDTANCNGSQPKAALMTQAQTIGAQFQANVPAAAGGGSPAASAPTGVVLSNVSRPGQLFQVGDNFKLVITGSPNQPITGSATQNGTNSGSQSYGSTDANGQKTLTGVMDASTVGQWIEVWKVGQGVAANLNFSVSTAAPAGGGSGGSSGGGSGGASGGGSGGSGGGAAPPAPPAVAPAFDLSFLTNTVSLFGFNVPVWALGAAAIGGVAVVASMGRR